MKANFRTLNLSITIFYQDYNHHCIEHIFLIEKIIGSTYNVACAGVHTFNQLVMTINANIIHYNKIKQAYGELVTYAK